jgi:hypothetical protein
MPEPCSQFWGLTVQALVGRLSEWASKHVWVPVRQYTGCCDRLVSGFHLSTCIQNEQDISETEPVCHQHRGWWCPQPFVSKRTIRVHLPSHCWDDDVSYCQIILCVMRYNCCYRARSKTLRHSERVCLGQWMNGWYVKFIAAVGTPTLQDIVSDKAHPVFSKVLLRI